MTAALIPCSCALHFRDTSIQLQLLDRVAGTTRLAADIRQMIYQARQLEDSLAELDDLADEEERNQMQALCNAVGGSKK